MRWRLSTPGALTWRELDDDIVVRNELTGGTHLLESLAADLLHTLAAAQAPLSVDELAAQIAGEGDARGELTKSIEATLSELQRLGLAEPLA